jgi:DNA polymerase-3 subunit delta'
MSFIDDLFWLESPARQLKARLQRDQPPQAQLIYGPTGVGRRHFALWSAAQILGVAQEPAADSEAEALPGLPHPDFFSVSMEEDAKVLKIHQIRDLITRLELTSHRGGRKVAIIWPADRMQAQAANCLLKTLEEPPGSATILLVCDSLSSSRMPATIVSRCERVRLAPPDWSAGLAWLQRAHPGDSGAEMALGFASRAPLAARTLLRADFGTEAAKLAADLERIVQREVSPGTVARRWARLDSSLCIRWLYWQLATLIREAMNISEPATTMVKAHLKISHSRLNMRACCDYLDQLNHATQLQDRALNQELQWAELLMWWYGSVGYAR